MCDFYSLLIVCICLTIDGTGPARQCRANRALGLARPVSLLVCRVWAAKAAHVTAQHDALVVPEQPGQPTCQPDTMPFSCHACRRCSPADCVVRPSQCALAALAATIAVRPCRHHREHCMAGGSLPPPPLGELT